MDTLMAFLTFLAGILLRIGIPVALTVVLISWLRRLDANWQAEAEQEGAALGLKPVGNCGCWKTMNCSAEKRAGCRAYADQTKPCWQVFRRADGMLQEKCLGCQVLKEAPVPVAM